MRLVGAAHRLHLGLPLVSFQLGRQFHVLGDALEIRERIGGNDSGDYDTCREEELLKVSHRMEGRRTIEQSIRPQTSLD